MSMTNPGPVTSEPIPVHVLSGFLGSGKTTLLNRLLKRPEFANSAVIINEFGEVGLDHHLVEASNDTIIELSNGCLCCTVRGELVDTLASLVDRAPERIVIETTGLADPVPVLQAIMATPALDGLIRFGGLATVFDAEDGPEVIRHHGEADRQLRLADVIVLSKLDAMDEPTRRLGELTEGIADINPAARIVSAEDFVREPALFLHATVELDDFENHHHRHNHGNDPNRHSDQIQAVLLTHDLPVERAGIDMFFDLLLSAHGKHVLRAKGLVNIAGKHQPLLVQCVGARLSEPVYLDAWPEGESRTRLVVFVDGMEGEFVKRLFDGFMDTPVIDGPDRTGLTDNPLAIPGFAPKR